MTDKFEGNYSEATVGNVLDASNRLVQRGEEMQAVAVKVLDDLAVIAKGNTRKMGEHFAAFMLTYTLAFTRAIAKPGASEDAIQKLHRAFINEGFRTLMASQQDNDDLPPELREMLEAMGLDSSKMTRVL